MCFHPAFWWIIWCNCMHIYSSNFIKYFAKYRHEITFTCIRRSPFISKILFGEIYAYIFFFRKNNLLAYASISMPNTYKQTARNIRMLNRTLHSCEQESMKNVVLWKYLISKPEHWPAENAKQTMELKLTIQDFCIFPNTEIYRFLRNVHWIFQNSDLCACAWAQRASFENLIFIKAVLGKFEAAQF